MVTLVKAATLARYEWSLSNGGAGEVQAMTNTYEFIRTMRGARLAALGLLAAGAVSLGAIAAPLAGTTHAGDGLVEAGQIAVAGEDRLNPPTDCRLDTSAPATTRERAAR